MRSFHVNLAEGIQKINRESLKNKKLLNLCKNRFINSEYFTNSESYKSVVITPNIIFSVSTKSVSKKLPFKIGFLMMVKDLMLK